MKLKQISDEKIILSNLIKLKSEITSPNHRELFKRTFRESNGVSYVRIKQIGEQYVQEKENFTTETTFKCV